MKYALCIALLLLCVPAYGGSAEVKRPITVEQCREHVKLEGVQLARLRWQEKWERAKVDAIPFLDEAPEWYIAMIRNWIAEVYAWQGSAEEWLESAYVGCGEPA